VIASVLSLERVWCFGIRCLGLGLPFAALACGPAIKITPNEYSRRLPPATVEADIAHCEEIADEVQAEYGPHVEIGDSALNAASENFSIHNRYKSACLRAKGYQVGGHDPIDLPASAVEEARASHGSAGVSEPAE
jgi:hypothetical protein